MFKTVRSLASSQCFGNSTCIPISKSTMAGIENMPEDSEESFPMVLHSDHHPTKPSQEEEKNVDSLRDCNSEEHKSGLTIAIKTEPKETELCLLMDESGCVDDPLQCVSVDLGGTSLVIKEETCDFNSDTDEYRMDDDPLLHGLQMKDNHNTPLIEGDAEAEGIDLIKMIFKTDGEEIILQPALTARPLTENKRRRKRRTCLSRIDPAERIRRMRAAQRATETEEDADRRREKERRLRLSKRATETEEEADRRRAIQRARKQVSRARDKRQVEQKPSKSQERVQRLRSARIANETAEETAARLAQQREQTQKSRALETPEAACRRRTINRLSVQRRRAERLANESAEQTEQRLAQQRQQEAESRAKRIAASQTDGDDKFDEQRRVWAQQQRRRRANLTPQQVEARRLRERIVKMKQRLTEQLLLLTEEDNETVQQRRTRLLKETRQRRQQQIATETPEQTAERKRRQAAQSYKARRRLEAVETPEECAARKRKAYLYMKRRNQQIMATETPEEHAARNERSRLYQRKLKERRDLVSADFDDISRKRKRNKKSTTTTTTVTSCVQIATPTTMECNMLPTPPPPHLFQRTMES